MNTTELKKLAEAATPGPWSYEDDSSFDDGHNVMSGGYYIAECFDAAGDQPEYKTAVKNAEFIAAANPAAILELLAVNAELVEALKGCMKALDAIADEMTVGERYTNAGQYLLDALPQASAAIAKHGGAA